MRIGLKSVTWLLAALLCLMLVPAAGLGETVEELYLARSNGDDYAAYLHALEGAPAISGRTDLYAAPEGVALTEGQSFSFTVTVEEDVFAYPVITYAMTGNNILDNVYSLLVDGQSPYAECTALSLDAWWSAPDTFEKDRYGNEVVSMPVKEMGVYESRLYGKAGLYSKGMGLMLTAGTHEITLACKEGPFALYAFSLAGEIVPGEGRQGQLQKGAAIAIQAEKMPLRNNPNVRAAADYDMALTPYSSDKKVINYVEDISYRYPGDMITYTFTVEEEGDYALGLHMRQADHANFPVFRTFYVDGCIPSPDFDNVQLTYSLGFGNQSVLDGEGKPALVHLTAGEHTLTIQTSLDPLRPAIQMLTLISDEMAALALDITKITGGNTDFFRDFNLADFDFHIAEDMEKWISELKMVRSELQAIAGSNGRIGFLSSLDVALEQLELLALEPDNLPKKLNQFTQGSSSVRSFLVSTAEELGKSPMGLDSIHFYTDKGQLPQGPGLFPAIGAGISRFFASFGDQGYTAGLNEEAGVLQVWVNRPRQYLEILQRMADTSFTPQTGVKVEFSIMPDESKLVLANASGSAPDVALGVSTGRTYDLAVRGALMDLRGYNNFKEVGRQFPAGLLIPGVCNDGIYALPETFNFYVLFYRKDILDNIGVEVPDSYEDVLKMLPTLHRFGLNFNNFVANAVGYKSFSITTPYIFQTGGKLYEDGNIKILLDEEAAIQGLELLTESFIVYDMDYEINSFYQSFRDGTLPIGTANYGMYNLLMNAAPELTDRWGIALYPGVTDENGVVQRWTSGAEQSCFIFSNTEMPDASWQFLTWWMSEETQTEFAFTLQSTLGNEYLWNSANRQAFLNSPWPTEHKKIIAEQMEWIYEAPRIPGNYMVEREISNAINAVCLEGDNLRAALDEAIKRIDREVERKLEEFGWIKDGELVVSFKVPDLDTVRGWLE
ncbi:MAG: extracellular solute-binding protein [Clostridiales bacterium]|nr:extracellular solute-binding protein [Clostridiales bacterium]